MIISGVLFVGYLVIGGILTLVHSPWAPSPYLSLTAAPGLYLTGAVVSLFIVQLTGSLILYNFLTGFNDERSQFVVLMSYVGLGFGGATLRFLGPPTLSFLLASI